MFDICVTFWQKRDSVASRKNNLKSAESLKIEKKFKDLESASASRKGRNRKRSSSYTSDPCTPPQNMQVSDTPVGTASVNNANDGATELDQMLIADDDNYLKPQHETTPHDVGRKTSI